MNDHNQTDPLLAPADFDLTLLANFVHQIVNPLNGVAGTLDNLLEGVVQGHGRREQRLNAARAHIEQCITLLRNLAFLAQKDGGVAEIDKRVVVLPQVIIEAAMFFQEDAKNKKIDIQLADRSTQNRVSGHHELIRQVLMNIYDNCIKYGQWASKIEVNQWVRPTDRMAIIQIIGQSVYPLDSEEITRVCELGFRGSNAKKVVASGSGLGLFICKQIIEDLHGGKFYIQANGDTGIEFLVQIPNGSRG